MNKWLEAVGLGKWREPAVRFPKNRVLIDLQNAVHHPFHGFRVTGDDILASQPEVKQWLRFAVRHSRAPGLWTVASLLAGVVALGDYGIAYLHHSLNTGNVVFLIFGLISIVVGFAVYHYEQNHVLERARKKLDDTVRMPINLGNRIKLSKEYSDAGYVISKGKHGFGFWSPAITIGMFDGCRSKSLKGNMTLRLGSYRGKDDLRRSAGAKEAVTAIQDGKLFRNDRKIRLCSDIFLNLGERRDIVLQETDYLASRSSNDLAFSQVDVRGPGLDNADEARTDTLYNGYSDFLSGTPPKSLEYRGYTNSECSNQIGVSTLAFTSDGWLLLVDQLKGGLENPDRIAPSGSGSLDWSDLPDDPSSSNFWEWLVEASTRELREELGIAAGNLTILDRWRQRSKESWRKSLPIHSVLIGFAGFLHRGGKPEFFLTAKLGCTLDELRANSIYSKEERFLSQRCQVGPGQFTKSFSAADIEGLIERNRGQRDSFPLELSYEMLSLLCRERPLELEQFFTE